MRRMIGRRTQREIPLDFLFLVVVLSILALVVTYQFAKPPAPLHSFKVVRFNPNVEPLIRSTLSTGENPRLLITDVVAERWDHVEGDCYRWVSRDRTELVCGVVHIVDLGPWGTVGIQ